MRHKILRRSMYTSHRFKPELLSKKVFSELIEDSGEQKKKLKIFFKMQRSAQGRFQLDVEELIAYLLCSLLNFDEKLIIIFLEIYLKWFTAFWVVIACSIPNYCY